MRGSKSLFGTPCASRFSIGMKGAINNLPERATRLLNLSAFGKESDSLMHSGNCCAAERDRLGRCDDENGYSDLKLHRA